MPFMSTDIKNRGIEEDFESVARHAFHREPLDPEVARRVQERAAHVTEKLRDAHGVIDDATFESLLEEDADFVATSPELDPQEDE